MPDPAPVIRATLFSNLMIVLLPENTFIPSSVAMEMKNFAEYKLYPNDFQGGCPEKIKIRDFETPKQLPQNLINTSRF
jgi:hypothetical protein